MKIALIHRKLVFKGGLENRLRNYCQYLVDRGHEVHIYYAKKKGHLPLPSSVHLHKVFATLVPKMCKQYLFSKQVKRAIKKETYDIILSLGRTEFQDAVLAPGNHLGYLKALKKKRLSWDDKMQIHMDQISFENSKIILAASEMIQQEIIDLYHIPADKIHVLYPPLNTKRYYQINNIDRNSLTKKFDIDPHKKSFGFVSTGHHRKGLPLLLKIFEALQEEPYELLIAGSPKVNTHLANVKNVGYLKEPAEFYNAIDYSIHPAIYEPFGQVVTESIRCGTPILISHKVGAKEILTPNQGLIIPSFEVNDWLDQIRQIDQHPFQIEDDFVYQKQLTLHHHMDKMLNILGVPMRS